VSTRPRRLAESNLEEEVRSSSFSPELSLHNEKASMPLFFLGSFAVLATIVSILVLADNPFPDQINLASAPNFLALRDCAYCCLCVGANCTSNQCISSLIHCSTVECLCQSSIVPLASEYLGICVEAACSSEADVVAYQQVFQSYCASVTSTTTTSSTGSTATAATTTGMLHCG
jgi:hypothetical protein